MWVAITETPFLWGKVKKILESEAFSLDNIIYKTVVSITFPDSW